MQKKLTWNAVGLYRIIKQLKEACEKLKNSLPEDHSREYRKLDDNKADLSFILKKIDDHETILIPQLD